MNWINFLQNNFTLFLCLLLISSFQLILANTANDEFVNYQIIDGDTLKKNQKRYRIQGIDSPELRQLCWIEDQPWLCGEASRDYLINIQGSSGMLCIKVDKDRYQRDIVKCSVKTYDGLKDVGSIMVEEGYALAYRRYSKDYIDEEELAKENKKGLWRTKFIKPWEWRRDKSKRK